MLLLLPWSGRSRLTFSRLSCHVSSYHVTAILQHAGDGSCTPVEKRRHKSNSGSNNWKGHERSVQSRKEGTKKDTDRRVSSELRKLCLEDFSTERERMLRSALEQEAGDFEVVFGISPCLLALSQGRRKVRKLFVKDGDSSLRASLLKVCEEAFRQGVQFQRVSKTRLDRMTSGRVHQGVCLQASPLNYLTDDLDSKLERKDNPLWLVLDRIQDPMNLGAILRTSFFLGVDRVVSSLRDSCPLSPVVSKASSGVMEVFGVYGCKNLEDMLKSKVVQGWQVVGTVAADADRCQAPVIQCSHFQMTKPTLLLMGGEGDGLSQTLLCLCQILLTIPAGRPLSPGIESLNVSVATGILLHSLLASRNPHRLEFPI